MGTHPANIKGSRRHLVQRILSPQVCACWEWCVWGYVCTRLPVGKLPFYRSEAASWGGALTSQELHSLVLAGPAPEVSLQVVI